MVSANHALSIRPLSVSQRYFSFLRWFKFERAVDALVAKQTYFMDLDPLLSVIRQVCQIEDEEEVTAMLNFYHDLGVIVKHGQTVVLQAQWLIDLFKQLINVPPFDEAVSGIDYARAFLFTAFLRMTLPSLRTKSCQKFKMSFCDSRVFPLGVKLWPSEFGCSNRRVLVLRL